MLKNITLSAITTIALFSTIGCGSSSSDSSSSDVKTGTGYYIDSAVEGLAYKCGTQEGNTTDKGAFTFDVGTGCEFYLGDMKLKSIDKSKLQNGVKIQETDIKIARVLMSLDSDKNPSNGIKIDAGLVKKALGDKAFNSLPVSDSEYGTLLEALSNAGATDVRGDDVTKHLFSNLLAGKTFYTNDLDSITSVATFTFGTDLTTMTVKDSKGDRNLDIDVNDEGVINIPLRGEHNYENLIIGDVTSDYIELKNTHQDSRIFKLFTDKTKAEKEYVKTPLPLTTDMLNGKTFYTFVNDEGVEKYIKLTFTTSTISGVEIKKSDGSKGNFSISYRIENNVLYFEDEADGIILVDKNANSWSLLWSGDSSEDIWYLSKPANFPADL